MTYWLRWIAPSATCAVRRTLLILAAAGAVLAVTLAVEGWPTSKRDIHRNERLDFQADFRFGPVNFLGQIIFIAVSATVGHRVFQIRL
ncbi:hypothetical protein DYQ86_02400 [Acidobacteria bacterium AB60]|nr:hypothetical protein DYQ86_02400 [Acidobacteria bacterium AB60]